MYSQQPGYPHNYTKSYECIQHIAFIYFSSIFFVRSKPRGDQLAFYFSSTIFFVSLNPPASSR